MVQFNRIEEISMPAKCCQTYKNIAFDGCHYFFALGGECKVVKSDLDFCEKECFPTCREYSCISYDARDRCFWAASHKCSNRIFKLNRNLEEIDSISVVFSIESCGIITGVSYDCYDDSILVSTAQSVIRISKCGKRADVIRTGSGNWITGVLALSPGYLITSIKDSNQCVCLYDANGRLLFKYNTPKDCTIKNIIFNPCIKKCKDTIVFYMLAVKKGCYPHIYKLSFCTSELGFSPYECCYDICHKCCDDKHCHKDQCAEILESIALAETAIARILNAEGEKLQKVIASTNDINKILSVNKEVNNTIINATHLEHVLFAKLREITDCCDFCRKDNHKSDHRELSDNISLIDVE